MVRGRCGRSSRIKTAGLLPFSCPSQGPVRCAAGCYCARDPLQCDYAASGPADRGPRRTRARGRSPCGRACPSARSRSRSVSSAREAPAQERDRRVELGLVVARRRAPPSMCSRVDADRGELARDALGAPAVELAPVLGEALRVAARRRGSRSRPARRPRRRSPSSLAALGLEVRAHLGHRAVAAAEVAVRQFERAREVARSCRVRRGRRPAPAPATGIGSARMSRRRARSRRSRRGRCRAPRRSSPRSPRGSRGAR